jgi:hypothetical protein
MKRIEPDFPVLLFASIGGETPFLLRFLDAYLLNSDRPEWFFETWRDSEPSAGPSDAPI